MSSALATDLYELTMIAGYWNAGISEVPATFELFVRRLPPARGYLVAAGLEPALAFLESVRFDESDCAALASMPQFEHVDRGWFNSLAGFRFSGDVWAVPEGTIVFAQEPILRVRAPLAVAQVVETTLLATLTYQTSVATKASRCASAAAGRPIVEFGARRAHGIGAALDAARAAFIGGCTGTSFVEAAVRFGIPTSGTMAHSWVQAFATEDEAFREFVRVFPESAVLLLDTNDTLAAARWLAASGLRIGSVRLDSGDLFELSRAVRRILDEGGYRDTRIFVTSDLDEYKIAELVAAGAPIDGFGVGTALTTVDDAPSLSGVYKLVEVERAGKAAGVVKRSPDKPTWPGAKQVWRTYRGGLAVEDVIAAEDEAAVDGSVPLLAPVMRHGRRVTQPEPLGTSRARCLAGLEALPATFRRLPHADDYPVRFSDVLEGRRRTLVERLGQ